uniref:DUF3883 domain-containing protein n=1 Tax=Heterorhabditis bacteriophora TaxID=37862 RepID=A0A1I7XI30_HETBA
MEIKTGIDKELYTGSKFIELAERMRANLSRILYIYDFFLHVIPRYSKKWVVTLELDSDISSYH